MADHYSLTALDSEVHASSMYSKDRDRCSSPLSQASTAPSTPDSRFSTLTPSLPGSKIPGEGMMFMLPESGSERDDFGPDLTSAVARRSRHVRRARTARALRGLRPCHHRVATLLFVDVDGVLNVGLSDGNSNPLAINRDNLRMLERLQKVEGEETADVQMLSFLGVQRAEGESLTFAELCKDSGDFVDAFVERFVKLLQAIGPSATVVLTSTWRLPKHAEKLCSLEAAISKKLCKAFKFEVRTPTNEHESPEGRLRAIAAFLGGYLTEKKLKAITHLRALVLEDFHVNPLGSWSCDGRLMSCTEDVETYLRNRIPENIVSATKLLHTYSEWQTLGGKQIRVASGLTQTHFEDGMEFLQALPQ